MRDPPPLLELGNVKFYIHMNTKGHLLCCFRRPKHVADNSINRHILKFRC